MSIEGPILVPQPILASNNRLLIATAVGLSLQAGAHRAHAQDAGSRELPEVTIEGHTRSPYKPDEPSSPKYTAPLLDTPQTLTVIPREVIEDQSLLTLREVLATVPGITFGAGEGGGGYGDSINLRGFAGSNDITVDGIRDSAQYTRSDPFNLERLEIVNGASSVYAGAGAVGGSVNLVSKAPLQESFARFVGAAATDDYGRMTADINHAFRNDNAIRANVVWHRNDVPGRDVERFERWGIAPSVAFRLGEATALTLGYFRQSDDNIPQYGVPTFRGGLLEGADIEAYYGYRNIDRQEIDADALSAVVKHDFNERSSLRNQTRAQRVDQLSQVDPPQGTYCLASTGLTPAGSPCVSNGVTVAPGFYLPSGPRGTVRDTRNEALINQTDVIATFRTGGFEHSLVAGLSIAHETYRLRNGNVLRNADGTTAVLAQTPIDAPDSLYTGPVNFVQSGYTEGELDNQALYAFDTLKLSESWQINAGARYERNDGSSTVTTIALPIDGGTTTRGSAARNSERLFSYRAGLVYKPAARGTIYLAYGNSQTPAKVSVNGSCTLLPTSSNGVPQFNANCNVKPEEGENYELGTKWDLRDARLALTAAVFRNERTNYRVNDPGNPDNPAQEQRLDGRARVDGAILGLGGLLRDGWGLFANYTYLDSEVLQGASDFVSSLGEDYTRGDPLLNVPRNALSLWTVYDLPRRLQLGYGVTYQGEIYVSQHSSANPSGRLATASGYAVHRAMLRYGINRRLDLQLNVNNLFDKQYFTRIRTAGDQAWATPGERRQIILSASYGF